MATKNFYTIDSSDKLFCKCDGVTTTFVDSSLSPKTITANGNATQLPIKFNKSAGFFNGTSDYVVVPDSADWDFGTGDFDIEAMIFGRAFGSYNVIVDSGYANNFMIRYDHATPDMYVILANTGFSFPLDSTTLSANTWYHIRLKRTGTELKFYLDGVQQGDAKTSSNNITGSSTGLNIGRQTNNTNFWNGWIKELRIIKGASTTVTVPTTQYTATSEANTVLLMHFDTPATSPLAPAIAFDGTVDILTVADHADFDMTSFTVEGVFRFNANVESRLWSIGTWDSGGCAGYYNSATSQLRFYINGTSHVASWTPTPNVAYAIRWVKSGTAVRMFVNGVQVGTDGTQEYTLAPDSVVTIGCWTGQSSSYFAGYLREFRISNVARDSAANYTPSQNGFTVDANTKLYIKGNENNGVTTFVDSETTPKTVTTAGDTKIKYTEDYRSCIFKDETGKFPYPVGSAKVDFFAIGSGCYWGGVNGGDYISAPDSDDWNLGTDPYTLEAWARFDSITGDAQVLIDMNTGITGGAGVTFCLYNGTNFGQYSGGADRTVAQTYTTNTWYHLTASRTGTSLKYFINGNATATDPAANSDNIQNGTATVKIGSQSTGTYFTKGRLDNVRISKGVARYVSTFNPPEFKRGGNKLIMWVN